MRHPHAALMIRGPGVQAGSSTDALTLNTDFFLTFTDLAGIRNPEYVTGRSLRPLLEGSAATTTWRTAFLLERRNLATLGASLYGIRTSDGGKYIEYEDGFRELYDPRSGPNALVDSCEDDARRDDLARYLQALKGCAGATCRAAEDGR